MPDLANFESFELTEQSDSKSIEKPVEKPVEQPQKTISEKAKNLVNKIAFWKKSAPSPNPDVVFKEIAELPLEQPKQPVQAEPLPVKEVPVEAPVEVPAEIPVQVKAAEVQEVPQEIPNVPKVEPTVVANPERGDRLKTNDVLEQLKPEKSEDDEGNERTVFTFANKNGAPVKVVFYSPDELPYTADAITGREAFIYGEKPKNRSSEEWQAFVDKTKNSSKSKQAPVDSSPVVLNEAINSGASILFIEATPQHLLDLAFTLGREDKDLQDGRNQAVQQKLTPQVTAIIDRIIAGKIIDDTGELNVETNYNGEALAIQALMGDKKAQEILEEKWRVLDEMNKKQEQVDTTESRQLWETKRKEGLGSKELQLEDLVVVHLTNYCPSQDASGQYEMQNTFNASEWSVPRNTIHFALNHPVQANSGGSWDDMPYAIIAPLDKMVEANGKPYILNPVDTSFEVSPGDRLKLPEGTIIVQPGKIESGNLYEKRGDRVIFKTENYTPQDISAIAELDQSRRFMVNFNIQNNLRNLLEFYPGHPFTNEDIARLDALTSPQSDILKLLEQKPIREVVDQLLSQSGLSEKVAENTKLELVQKIQGPITARLKEDVIRQTIRELGYADKTGGSWDWGGPDNGGEQVVKIAAEMGVKTVAHGGDISSDIESGVLKMKKIIKQSENPREKMEKYNELRDQMKAEDLAMASQKNKRMMYLMGAF